MCLTAIYRQRHAHGRAVPGFAFNVNLSAMPFNKLFAQNQAQARAGFIIRAAPLAAGVNPKQPLQIIRRNAENFTALDSTFKIVVCIICASTCPQSGADIVVTRSQNFNQYAQMIRHVINDENVFFAFRAHIRRMQPSLQFVLLYFSREAREARKGRM